MKVLFCHNSYQIRSGEDVAAETDIRLLREHGVEVMEYRRSNDDLLRIGLTGKLLFPLSTLFSWRSYREMRKLIRERKPDVALVQNVYPLISPSVYYALAHARVPIVQLAYNYRLMCANGSFFTQGRVCQACLKGGFWNAIRFRCYKESRILSAIYGFSIALHRRLGLGRKISAYISPARYLMSCLEQAGYPAERMHHVFNPFDSHAFRPEEAHKSYFLYFGRIVREKGIMTLLEAVRRHPELKLIVVGKGEAEEEMTHFIETHGLTQVQFLGPKYGEELDAVLKYATAVITPVEWLEVSPLVAYQAFSVAKPVISSKIQCMPEIVRDEENGLLFETGDPEDLARQMTRLLGDETLRLRLSRNARAMAERNFTGESRFNHLMDVLRQVV